MKPKPNKKKDLTELSQGSPSTSRSVLKRRLLLGLLLVMAGVGAWAFFEFIVWNNVPSDLVGKWVVTKGPDEGGTVDFYRNGTMIAKVNQGGYEGIIQAKIRVEDKKIHVTTRNVQTGQEGTRVQTIKSLAGNLLILQDERGATIHLEKAE